MYNNRTNYYDNILYYNYHIYDMEIYLSPPGLTGLLESIRHVARQGSDEPCLGASPGLQAE